MPGGSGDGAGILPAMRRRRGFLALLFAGLLLIAGCGGNDSATSDGTTTPAEALVPGCETTPPATAATTKQYDTPPKRVIDTSKFYEATIKTSCGDISMTLDAKNAPNTVNNFVFLARDGYYDGLTFHRVVKNFVIQGGDPTGTGRGGPGYEFDDELPKNGYRVGSVAMANAGPNTNGSQFFIVTGLDGESLNSDYSLFGQVFDGLDAAKRIESLADPNADPVDPASQEPRQTAWIYSVTITERDEPRL